MTPRCTWDKDRGWLTAEHRADCREGDCAGCRPCGKSHCAMRDRCGNHVEQHAGIYTCPSCIGKTRRAVKAIAVRYAELPAEFEFIGVESEVLNLHGPAAFPGQWAERRRRLAEQYADRGWCDFPRHGAMADDDPHHPLAVLGRWDIAVRESYGHPSDLFVTVSRAVDYLAGDVLSTLAHTKEFEEFAKDIASCLSHLEDVLALTERPEQGAPCPTCRVDLAGQLDDEGKQKKAKRLLKHYGADLQGKQDTWHCPTNPEHWWGDVDYRARVEGDYVEQATELTADQAAKRFDIKASVIRVWGSRGHVRKCGLNRDGITLYDVKDIAKRHAEDSDACA